MSKIRTLRKLLLSRKTALVVGAGLGGASAGFTGSLPGLRKEGAVEGAVAGAGYTSAALLGLPIVFRRIRGRIIPIRIKK